MGPCRKFTILICLFAFSAQALPVHAQFSSSYKYYIDLSHQAIARRDFQGLLFYVESAHLADPQAQVPFELIKQLPIYQNNIAVLKGYLLQAVQALDRKAYRSALFYFELSLLVTPDDALIKEYIEYVHKLLRGEIVDEKPLVERIKREYKIELPIAATVKERKAQEQQEEASEEPPSLPLSQQEPQKPRPPAPIPAVIKTPQPKKSRTDLIATTRSRPQNGVVKDVIVMDDELWNSQSSGATIGLEFNQSIILEGSNIERYLVLDQDYLIIERLDRDRIKITSIRRGPTIMHVWDDRGRWTFNIRGLLPPAAEGKTTVKKEDLWEEYVQPFRLRYSNNWAAFYRGDSFDTLARTTLTFTQVFGIDGPTPYGHFDASGNLYRFPDTTENTQRTMGLSDAKIGPFKDFSVRGWDNYKRFSDLSLPGRYFRGGRIDAYAFDHRVLYTYLRGQDRATFVTLAEGVTDVRRSFIEAVRVTLFPDTIHQYSFNFGRGWGEERAPSLKEKVYSFDTEHQFGDFNIVAESAYDEEVQANIVRTIYEKDNYSLRVNSRHIHKDFSTLTSRPSGRGITGGNIVYNWEPDTGINFSTNLDLYKNHDIPNPDNPDALNYEIGTFVNVPLAQSLSWNNSAFYSDTPQLISPRESINLNTSLNKSFKILHDRSLSMFVGASHQRSRYEVSPQNDYDRSTLRAGLRFPILKNLSYFLNYDFNYIDPKEREGMNKPHVMTTGLSYNDTFWDTVSLRASVSYRDEEDTEGQFTFLSGTDILRSNLGVSYRPNEDYEIFVDGSYRNIWAENNNQAAFNDADVRFGVRANWDLFFAWNPKTTVSGFAYKDYNKNGVRDLDEPGIADIRVRVGDKIAITNAHGFYTKEARAKEVKVGVNLDTIPEGHSLTGEVSQRFIVEQGKRIEADFGFSVRTEVYGIVFVDENDNNRYDIGEKTVPRVKVQLNGKQTSFSDFEGIYSFYEVAPGEHTLTLDVNTLSLEYLPKIKLTNTINVYEGSSISFNFPLIKK